MTYLYHGNLSVQLCRESKDPLRGIKINAYKQQTSQNECDVKHTPKIISAAAIAQMDKIGEGTTDADGNFSIKFNSEYKGGGIQLAVYCDEVPGQHFNEEQCSPVEFLVAAVRPLWHKSNDGFSVNDEHTIPCKFWCHVLSLFDVRIICGKIVSSQDPSVPVAGAEVTAFDSKWIANNRLGMAVTNKCGYFSIYYSNKNVFQPGKGMVNYPILPDVNFDVKSWGVWCSLMNPKDSGLDVNTPLSALLFVLPFQHTREAVA